MDDVIDRGVAPQKIFYGWWVVGAAFLNLFFTTGVIYYCLPVFYSSFVSSLGFTRAQVTQGFLLGFILVGLPFGYIAGVLIDRFGARAVILLGLGFVGMPLILMGSMDRLWQYQTLCLFEVLGYVLAGPIANQVLIARWFRERRGRAMGLAYLGLGLGGVVGPPTASALIHSIGWRHALHGIGLMILLVLVPVGLFVTRSGPEEMQLQPDGRLQVQRADVAASSYSVMQALRTQNFWLLLVGSGLVVGTINTVIQHFVLLLQDHGYPRAIAARFLSILLASSLASRVLVGYFVDRAPQKKDIMAVCYLLIGLAVPLLLSSLHLLNVWGFALLFGFAMGADYMLIPLVTAECFGLSSLGKVLGAIVMGYSVGQWLAPWLAGRIFDARHSYDLAWIMVSLAAVAGALAVFAIRTPQDDTARPSPLVA